MEINLAVCKYETMKKNKIFRGCIYSYLKISQCWIFFLTIFKAMLYDVVSSKNNFLVDKKMILKKNEKILSVL